jgi:hypothetical protein
MNVVRAYKLSLALPLVVPALLAPLSLVDNQLPKWLRMMLGFTVYSGLIGGLPYLVVIALLLFWARGKGEAQIRRGLVLSPLLMLPVCLVFIVVIGLVRSGRDLTASEFYDAVALFAPFILGFGYTYVVLVLGVVWLLRRRGVLISSPLTVS